ncbi:hypothetical protein [Domibacillus robiginosus]|nr:hypothetical protein [Domibacillus robiginosus]
MSEKRGLYLAVMPDEGIRKEIKSIIICTGSFSLSIRQESLL